MSTPTPKPSYSLVITTITMAETTLSYSTTFVMESPLPAPPGKTSMSTWTTTTLWVSTIPATTITSVISVPILAMPTSSTSSTVPSTLVTSTTALATTISTTSSLHPIDTTASLPSGITAVQKSTFPKTTAIVIGILVPVAVIVVVVITLVLRKKCKKGRAKFTIQHWWENPHVESPKSAKSVALFALPPPPAPPAIARDVELDTDHGPFRVGSPPRPRRPRSIPESILKAMSDYSGQEIHFANAPSDHGHESIELAHLRSPRSYSGDDDEIFISNTDIAPAYDGTRKKYLRTALEHNMPLTKLTRPSLRVSNAQQSTLQNNGNRRSEYIPEPLRIHKRSNTDTNVPGARGGQVESLEHDESEYPSPVPTEQEFIANVRSNFSKTPPLDKAAQDHIDLMNDASSHGGSFIQDNEILQKREDSLAALEGRTPAITSFGFGRATGRLEQRDAFGRPIPPRSRAPIPQDQMTARRQANIIDEGKINEWI